MRPIWLVKKRRNLAMFPRSGSGRFEGHQIEPGDSLVPRPLPRFQCYTQKRGRAWCASAREWDQLHAIKYWRGRTVTASAWRRLFAHAIKRTIAWASTRFPGKMALRDRLNPKGYRDLHSRATVQSAKKEAPRSKRKRPSVVDRSTDRRIWLRRSSEKLRSQQQGKR